MGLDTFYGHWGSRLGFRAALGRNAVSEGGPLSWARSSGLPDASEPSMKQKVHTHC